MVVVGKKKKTRVLSNGVIHVRTTLNNTIISLADERGDVLFWVSTGSIGFKNAKKRNTPYAAQMTALKIVEGAKKYGVKNVKVFICGSGAGRDIILRTILEGGIFITEITDRTSVQHNGCRPPKRKRN